MFLTKFVEVQKKSSCETFKFLEKGLDYVNKKWLFSLVNSGFSNLTDSVPYFSLSGL